MRGDRRQPSVYRFGPTVDGVSGVTNLDRGHYVQRPRTITAADQGQSGLLTNEGDQGIETRDKHDEAASATQTLSSMAQEASQKSTAFFAAFPRKRHA